ncbi:MAG: tetratricopeptide repeat protein [Candidatus Poribacteria bacterium]|nr:tetratricopeptide repeat protein [Candidatus Poribacteria bacterium]MDE0503541.1 tetratricopeptide repeat protein [Candidatus Poribacteria bacterium]
MHTILAICLASFCSIEPSIDLSKAELQPTEKQLLYAEQLFERRIYNPSILEYKRFLFYQSHTDMADFAHYRIAQAHYYQGNRGYSRQLFGEFMKTFPESPLYYHAQFMLGKTHLDDGENATARSAFFRILQEKGDESLRVQAQYLRGWCYLHDRNWFKAISEFRDIRRLRGENRDIGSFDARLERTAVKLADTTLANTPLPLKSPRLAQFMSTVIPGSGQIYAGKIRNGLISLGINAAFFYLLGDSVADKRYVDAAGIFLVGSRFYWGNRHNAKKWAKEYNQNLEMGLIERLKSIEREAIE